MSLEDTLYPLLRFYEAAPQPVKSLAGRAYRAIPASLRYGGSYARFQAEAREAESWDANTIQRYQIEALRESFIAASKAPFYARRFAEHGVDPVRFESLEQLANYPVLTKQELISHRDEMLNPECDASQRLYMTTGGSTGEPVGFYLHKGVSRPKEQAYLEALWSRRGYRVGDRVAVIRGGVTSTRAEGAIESYDASRDSLILSSYHLTEHRVPEYIAALSRFRPKHLNMYPSSALMLSQWMEDRGVRLDFPITSVLCGSEKLTPTMRALFEKLFGAPVYHWYGHSERVVLAGQGPTGDHLYFCPAYGYVEFGEADEQGLSEVIGTSFHNHVMPLIRYRTGDRVRLASPNECQSECPGVEIVEVAGRDHEFLVSATGRRISLTAMNMHDDAFDGLAAVQFAQLAPGVVECRYVCSRDDVSSRESKMRERLRRKLGDDFDLRLRRVSDVEKTPGGKHRWLVSDTAASTPNAVAFHDAKAAQWDALYQRPSFQMRRTAIMSMIEPHLSKDMRWLDAGCGSGFFARELARGGCDVVGVDAAAGMVADAHARAMSEGLAARTTFQQVDSIETLPFADAAFDGVLCSSVIEYVSDYTRALRELARVLRPGGVVLVTVPNKVSISRVIERAVHAVTSRVMASPWPRYLKHSRWQFSAHTLGETLAGVGLSVVDTNYFGPLQPAWLNQSATGGMMLAMLARKG